MGDLAVEASVEVPYLVLEILHLLHRHLLVLSYLLDGDSEFLDGLEDEVDVSLLGDLLELGEE